MPEPDFNDPVQPPTAPGVCTAPVDGTRPDATLVNVDSNVLARFPLTRVMNQLVSLAGTQSIQTGTQLYQQLWDSLDIGANALFPNAPHCDDPGAINNFVIECKNASGIALRPEVSLKTTPTSQFKPVAVMNRFDLAPANGAHCGEYRIVFAKTPSSTTNRDFIIFEAALPNPNPSCGIEACRPVVAFWENLATLPANSVALADALESFYFTGLPGFEPVVHPQHYGTAGGDGYGRTGAGQIRTNMFMTSNLSFDWQLREYHLAQPCRRGGGVPADPLSKIRPSASCPLVIQPVTVKSNPQKALFGSTSTDPRVALFQSAPSSSGTGATFADSVALLSASDVNDISMRTANLFNAGQSNSFSDDYDGEVRPAAFSNIISAQIASASGLTETDIVNRATTQSCAGCHELSNGRQLGGNLTWPNSRGFVHIDENSQLSQALWCEFLPKRKSVLDGFANTMPQACIDIASKGSGGTAADTGLTVAGRSTGSAN
jgi:hypothetical protein